MNNQQGKGEEGKRTGEEKGREAKGREGKGRERKRRVEKKERKQEKTQFFHLVSAKQMSGFCKMPSISILQNFGERSPYDNFIVKSEPTILWRNPEQEKERKEERKKGGNRRKERKEKKFERTVEYV